jgi:hypothetical protein
MDKVLIDPNKQKNDFYSIVKDPEYAAKGEDYAIRERIYNNMGWIEKYDVLGVMKITPLLESNLKLAHNVLKRSPAFSGVEIMDFIESDEIRILFAAYVAQFIILARCKGGPRNQLDASYARTKLEIKQCREALDEYRWDNVMKNFYLKKKNNENSSIGFGDFPYNKQNDLLYPKYY